MEAYDSERKLGQGAMGAVHLVRRKADNELLALKRRPFARTITEREWLRGAGRMWELIRRSALLADYNKSLQKLHCYG